MLGFSVKNELMNKSGNIRKEMVSACQKVYEFLTFVAAIISK